MWKNQNIFHLSVINEQKKLNKIILVLSVNVKEDDTKIEKSKNRKKKREEKLAKGAQDI